MSLREPRDVKQSSRKYFYKVAPLLSKTDLCDLAPLRDIKNERDKHEKHNIYFDNTHFRRRLFFTGRHFFQRGFDKVHAELAG
jgi:hypothetical protein